MWLKAKGFKNLIDDWWKSFEFRGVSSFVVTEKLKALKSKIKCWNKEVFGRVEVRKNQALKEPSPLGLHRGSKTPSPV